jgi:hypothetical protein
MIIFTYLSLNKIFYDTLLGGITVITYKDFSSLDLVYFLLSFFEY